MLFIYSVAEVLSGMAISLGVGSSTFALLFYFMSIRTPSLRETGRPYQKIVYLILRISMALILLTEIVKVVLYLQTGTTWAQLFAASVLLFLWTIVAVLFANAVLMTLHIMPMKFGPAIQASSWYALGILTSLPVLTATYLPLLLGYLGGIVAFAVIIELISRKLAPRTELVAENTSTPTSGNIVA